MPLIARIAMIVMAAAILLTTIAPFHYFTPLDNDAAVDVVGFVESLPTESHPSFQLRVSRKVSLRVRGNAIVGLGDRLRVRGRWMTLRIGDRPSSDGLIIATAIERVSPKKHWLLSARGAAQAKLHELFPTTYPLAEALLISQRENLNQEVRENFAASGLTHLLAISGSHVALVAASLLLLARLLRLSIFAASSVSFGGAAAYVLFLGAPYAAVRALIQMLLLAASRLLQRPAHPVGLLAGAALLITVIEPAAPLDAGFQLSFAGILGIVLWRRPLIELLPASIPHAVRDAMATTCAATAATTPIAAFHFGTVSLVALPANLLAAPVVALAVPTAALALALGVFSTDAGKFVAGGSEITLLWLYRIAQTCADVRGGHFAVTRATAIAVTLAAGFAFLAVQSRRRAATTDGRLAIALCAGLLPIVATPLFELRRHLEIHMIDVGQGDAFAIRSPRGRWLLVDAGPASDRFNAGKAQVVPFLLQHQAGQLAAVVLSHPHLDHFGGLAEISKRIDVEAVLDPAMAVPGEAYSDLLQDTRKVRWLKARRGAHMNFDGAVLDFLAPEAVPLDASADPNDYSAAFRLRYGSFSALFLGDMSAAREIELVRSAADLDVDLLKVSHHGSRGSSSADLLLATSPRVALVSAGRRNRYRHPHAEALERLRLSGARVFRTDRDGTVTVAVSEDGRIRVRPAR